MAQAALAFKLVAAACFQAAKTSLLKMRAHTETPMLMQFHERVRRLDDTGLMPDIIEPVRGQWESSHCSRIACSI
jgi:hypothetical protein